MSSKLIQLDKDIYVNPEEVAYVTDAENGNTEIGMKTILKTYDHEPVYCKRFYVQKPLHEIIALLGLK